MISLSLKQSSIPLIAVAAPVGGGKSTLVRGLAQSLPGAAAIHFDHYERITQQPIETIKRWLLSGAQLDEMQIAGLSEDLQALKQGYAVTGPMSSLPVKANRYVIFETQFGRQHAATGRHIDYLIWVETPLDIALARKLRQLSSEFHSSRPHEAASFVSWLQTYLDNYLDVVGELLRIQRDTVGANADFIADGMMPSVQLLEQVRQEILKRFP
jgi:uridine kinase